MDALDVLVLICLIMTLIAVTITRWVFRIDTQITNLLTEIRDNLKKKTK